MFSDLLQPQATPLANLLAGATPLRVAVDTWDSTAHGQLRSMLSAFDDVLVCDADFADVTLAIGDTARGSAPVLALVRDEAEAARALSGGAQGIVLRTATPSRIHAALHAVAEGLYVSEMQIAVARESAPLIMLTARENDVVRLLAAGLTNKEIAHRLGITENTVKFHVNGILGKLGVETRTEAVVHAARLGIVTL
jgi:DNA-binding NarL/FixJ family response regulator